MDRDEINDKILQILDECEEIAEKFGKFCNENIKLN